MDRRPIPVRTNSLSVRAAKALANLGVTPNQISIASIAFAAAGALLLVLSRDLNDVPRCALLLFAAACIPARLLCNLLDGMVAIEFEKQSPSGDVFNELPDRVSDMLLLAAAGYAVPHLEWLPIVAWSAAVLALLTAYVRTLGASQGQRQDYSGPMAKQQRMAVLAIACIGAGIEGLATDSDVVLAAGLTLVAIGSAFTVMRRTHRLIASLEAG